MLQASLAEGQQDRESLREELAVMEDLLEAYSAVQKEQESTITLLETECQEVRPAAYPVSLSWLLMHRGIGRVTTFWARGR